MRNVAIYVSAKNNTLRNQFVLYIVGTYLLETCQAPCCVVVSRVWSRCIVILLCCVVAGCAVWCGVVDYGTELRCTVLCCVVLCFGRSLLHDLCPVGVCRNRTPIDEFSYFALTGRYERICCL